MPLATATIYFNDTASTFNRDLVDFLKRNIEKSIRQGRLTFGFKITQTSELAELRRMGIKRLPAMVIGKLNYIGVPDIIAEIRKRVETSKVSATPKSEDEVVRDFQMASLGEIRKDADGKLVVADHDDEDMGKDDFLHKAQMEMQRRGLTQAGKGDPADRLKPTPPPRPTDRTADRDDDYENRKERQTPRNNNAGYTAPINQPRPRADNLDNPQMGDAFAALNRVGRNATAEDRKDDELMANLLAKIGGE